MNNSLLVSGAKCILCGGAVELKLPVRIYLENRMVGEVVMICTKCKAIGTVGFDVKRCDFIQPKENEKTAFAEEE